MRRFGLLSLALLALISAPPGGALPERAAGDVTGTITPGGPPVTVTTMSPGDNVRLTFEGTVGQRVALNVTNISLSPAGSAEIVQILKPDQSLLGNTGLITSSGWIDTKTLQVAGTYTVFVDPQESATGSTTLTLYEVPVDSSSPLALGGGSVKVTITNPGQNAELPFSGAAGQQVRLYRSEITFTALNVKILKPDGSQLLNSGIVGTPDGSDTTTLPTTGTYKAVVDPYEAATGTATLRLRINGASPNDGAAIDCGTPVLRAEPDGSSEYQFQVASDAAFTTIVDDSGMLQRTNTYAVPVEDLAGSGSYYWRSKSTMSGWSAARSFTQEPPMLGVRDYWPVWSLGPLAVNQANGNLVVSLPGPSYPTAVGTLAASLTYNSLDSNNRGLGAGWTLVGGDEETSAPAELVDHNLLTGEEQYDAVEIVSADGSSVCYSHIGRGEHLRRRTG